MKKSKIFIKKLKPSSDTVTIPVYYFRLQKRGTVYAECPSIKLVTYGRNLEHAKTMFAEAFSLWQETVNEDDDAIEVFKELGWTVTPAHIIPTQPPLREPIYLLENHPLCLKIKKV